MSPKYKVIYMNARGLAEPLRFLLSYMEEDFEDVRLEREEWDKNKERLSPSGKLPLLEEEGKPVMVQSMAIARYLGKKAGLAGNDDFENQQIDAIVDTIVDTRSPIYTFYQEKNEDVKKAKKETYINETLPSCLKRLDAIAKANGGFLANHKLSWADFVFTVTTDGLSIITDVADITADYPNLQALKKKVLDIPQIKKWVAKRPVTQY